jgi:GT2 family glycosyltransferase
VGRSAETVCAVIVTRDRAALLRECLEAVLGQTRAPDRVLVVDNASTDETPQVLAEVAGRVEVLRLATNEGSAGGFHEGMNAAVASGADWLWVMDDDTIPHPDALERLLGALDRVEGLPQPALLASRVVWTNGEVHPINAPAPHALKIDLMLRAAERGLVPIRSNTFPSLLVRAEAVARYGAPRKGFFLWADDIDFTQRILRHETGYAVPDSVALHKTPTPHAPWDGGERFYFAARNGLFLLRGDTLAPKEKVGALLTWAEQVRRFLLVERARPRALRILARGIRDGLLKPQP